MKAAVGVDVAAIEPVRQTLAGPHRTRYLARVYTDREVADCQTATGIDPARLAGQFAAKEATIKALGIGDDGLSFRDIEVRTDAAGRCRVVLHGPLARLARADGIAELALSVGYDTEVVIATVFAIGHEDDRPAPRPSIDPEAS